VVNAVNNPYLVPCVPITGWVGIIGGCAGAVNEAHGGVTGGVIGGTTGIIGGIIGERTTMIAGYESFVSVGYSSRYYALVSSVY
jgi:hypothetical protein